MTLLKTLHAAALAGTLGMLLVSGAARAAEPSGAGIPGESPCYAVFHEHRDGQGASIERQGPESFPRIRDMRYSDGRSLNSRVMSVTTGPAAKLELYAAPRYLFLMFEVGPESRVNLPNPTMDSYVLSCVEPPPPPQEPYLPPPDFK